MLKKIEGMISAPVSCLNADQSVNVDVVACYADLLRRNGVAGVFVNGTTGEGYSLCENERKELASAWIKEQRDDFKIIIHIAATDSRVACRLAKHAQDQGAYAIGAMAPIFFKSGTVDELADYCEEIAGAAPKLPFYFYHMPAMSGVNLPMIDLLKAVDGRIENFAGVKFTYENLMDFELCRAYKDGKYDMLHGRDETWICSLALGTTGAVGSTYNFMAPLYSRMTTEFKNGNLDEARTLQRKSIEVITYLCATSNFFSAAKAVLRRLGVDTGPVRTPLKGISDEQIKTLNAALDNCGFDKVCNK